MILPIAQGIPRFTPVEMTRHPTPSVNNGHCGLASDSNFFIEAGSTLGSFFAGTFVSATTIGGAMSGLTGCWIVVVEVSFPDSMGGLAFEELFRIRSAVKIGPEVIAAGLDDFAIRSVELIEGVEGRVANDRTWATIGVGKGPARAIGTVQAQARATPSPCRAAILAGRRRVFDERVALLYLYGQGEVYDHGSGVQLDFCNGSARLGVFGIN